VDPHAVLDEDRRPGGIKPDRDNDHQPQRQRREQPKAGEREVEQALERGLVPEKPVYGPGQPQVRVAVIHSLCSLHLRVQ